MTSSTLIVVSMIISVLVLTILFSVIWINRDTDRSAGILIRSIGVPLLIALALLASDIFSELPPDNSSVPVVFVHDDDYNLAPILSTLVVNDSTHSRGYLHLTWLLDESRSKKVHALDKRMSQDEQGEFALDLMEVTFWRWLSSYYPMHWDIKQERFRSLSGSMVAGPHEPDAERQPDCYSLQSIRGDFQANMLLQNKELPLDLMPPFAKICVPSGTEITTHRDKGLRRIDLNNRHIAFSIQFALGIHGNLADSFLPGKMKSLYETETAWSEESVNVSFRCDYSFLFRWSPMTNKQRRWVENIMKMFQDDFSWELVSEDLEKAYRQK
jgi:hypothetical protein